MNNECDDSSARTTSNKLENGLRGKFQHLLVGLLDLSFVEAEQAGLLFAPPISSLLLARLCAAFIFDFNIFPSPILEDGRRLSMFLLIYEPSLPPQPPPPTPSKASIILLSPDPSPSFPPFRRQGRVQVSSPNPPPRQGRVGRSLRAHNSSQRRPPILRRAALVRALVQFRRRPPLRPRRGGLGEVGEAG